MSSSKILSYKAIIEKRLCLRYLMHLSQPGIVAIINKKQKKILIIGSKYPLKSLSMVITAINNKTHSNKEMMRCRTGLNIVVLESCEGKHVLANKMKWIHNYTINDGYSLYNTEIIPKYEVKTRVLINGVMEVGIVTGGKRWYIVKRSSDGNEIEAFIKQYTLYDMLKML